MIVSRVIPSRMLWEIDGVYISPSLTTKMFSPGPSATWPSLLRTIASV
jgi:hypothetical protein